MSDLKTGSLKNCYVVKLPRIRAPEGSLTFIESLNHIPFAIRRTYYLYDVPGGATRGAHAHRNLCQLLIPVAGSFDVTLDDATDSQVWHLNRPYLGLLISPMVWRNLSNFSSGSVCLVLASELYDESDYIRDYHEFKSLQGRK